MGVDASGYPSVLLTHSAKPNTHTRSAKPNTHNQWQPLDSVSQCGSSAGAESIKRDRWGSRASFILAAVGSAVGIGNLWRFPFLAYRFGGGAFFIPYLIALFFVGIPILQLEFALGQFHQGGHAIAFGSLSKRAVGLGVAAPFSCFVVVVYYGAILAWSLIYMVSSFISPLPWKTLHLTMTETCSNMIQANCASTGACYWNAVKGECRPAVAINAAEYFQSVLNLDASSPISLHGCGKSVAGLAVTWLCIFFAIFKGAKFLGRVLYITMILPTILLLVMTVRSLSLPGADEGVKQYLWQWDLSVLINEPEIWSSAVGQIFFSIGVCYGVMTAYASFNQKGTNVIQDSFIVAFSNSAFSLVAGVVVFAVAGHLAFISNSTIEDLRTGGVGLVFMTFPTALAEMNNIASHIFSVLFFLMFFLLGIDSAFSMVEATVTLIADAPIMAGIKKLYVTLPACIIGFCCALPFVSNVAAELIDAVDFAMSNFASIFIGLSECTVAGWVQGAHLQADILGWPPVIFFALSYYGALILGTMLGFGVKVNVPWLNDMPAGVMLGPVFGTAFFVIGSLVSLWLTPRVAYGVPWISRTALPEDKRSTAETLNGTSSLSPIAYHTHTLAVHDLGESRGANSCAAPRGLAVISVPTSPFPRACTAAVLHPLDDICIDSGSNLSNMDSDRNVPRLGRSVLCFREKLWWLVLGNVETLRHDLNLIVAAEQTCCCCCKCPCPSLFSRLILPWSLTIKFLIPAFLLMVFVQVFFSTELPNFQSLRIEFRAAGIALASVAVCLVLLGVVLPRPFSIFVRRESKESGGAVKQTIGTTDQDTTEAPVDTTRQESDMGLFHEVDP